MNVAERNHELYGDFRVHRAASMEPAMTALTDPPLDGEQIGMSTQPAFAAQSPGGVKEQAAVRVTRVVAVLVTVVIAAA